MILEKQLILLFNCPVKNTNIKFKKDFYNWYDIVKLINDQIYFGEFNVNNSTNMINMNCVSHIVTKLYVEDDAVYADIKILDTQQGKLLKTYIENNIELIFRFNIAFSFGKNDYKIYSINVVTQYFEDYFDLKTYYRLKKIKQLMK